MILASLDTLREIRNQHERNLGVEGETGNYSEYSRTFKWNSSLEV
jgi:hypothetical protein